MWSLMLVYLGVVFWCGSLMFFCLVLMVVMGNGIIIFFLLKCFLRFLIKVFLIKNWLKYFLVLSIIVKLIFELLKVWNSMNGW